MAAVDDGSPFLDPHKRRSETDASATADAAVSVKRHAADVECTSFDAAGSKTFPGRLRAIITNLMLGKSEGPEVCQLVVGFLLPCPERMAIAALAMPERPFKSEIDDVWISIHATTFKANVATMTKARDEGRFVFSRASFTTDLEQIRTALLSDLGRDDTGRPHADVGVPAPRVISADGDKDIVHVETDRSSDPRKAVDFYEDKDVDVVLDRWTDVLLLMMTVCVYSAALRDSYTYTPRLPCVLCSLVVRRIDQFIPLLIHLEVALDTSFLLPSMRRDTCRVTGTGRSIYTESPVKRVARVEADFATTVQWMARTFRAYADRRFPNGGPVYTTNRGFRDLKLALQMSPPLMRELWLMNTWYRRRFFQDHTRMFAHVDYVLARYIAGGYVNAKNRRSGGSTSAVTAASAHASLSDTDSMTGVSAIKRCDLPLGVAENAYSLIDRIYEMCPRGLRYGGDNDCCMCWRQSGACILDYKACGVPADLNPDDTELDPDEAFAPDSDPLKTRRFDPDS